MEKGMKTKAGMSLSLLLTWLPVFSKDVPGEQKQNQKMLRNELNQMRNVQRVYTNIVFKTHPNSVIVWILKSHVTYLERSDSLSSVSQLLGFWEAFSTHRYHEGLSSLSLILFMSPVSCHLLSTCTPCVWAGGLTASSMWNKWGE